MIFFFKQKTAYDMRISDWSSDVCSSDLFAVIRDGAEQAIERLGSVIGTIVEAANSISSATVELNREAKGLAESAEAQTDSLDRTAADAASLSEAARGSEAIAKRANQRAGEIGRASWRERGCPYV